MKRDWTDYVKAGLPWLSNELEPLRNVLGEPVNRPNNSYVESAFPVTLAPVATWTKEPVLNELTRLYQSTGYAAAADPRSVLFGYKDAQDLKLEDGVSLYSHLIQPRATMQIDGQTLKQALGELIQTPEYKDAVDGTGVATSLGEQTKGGMVGAIFARYSGQIKAEVASQSPIALRYMTAAAAKHRDNGYLATIPLDKLANDPSLYDAHGVDPQQYSDKITAGAAGSLVDALQK